MNRFLRLFAVALLLLPHLRCSSGGPSSPSGQDANILRVNLGAEVQDLDPHVTTGIPEHRALYALFEGLTDLDPKTMSVIPAAAERWSVAEDGVTYTFQLRRDGKWSNGDPLTAQDFVYSYERMLTPALGAEYAYFLYMLKNGKAFNEGTLKDFTQVGAHALDDYTLEIVLEHPTPYFLSSQMHQAWFPVHRATIEKFGAHDVRGTKWTRAGNLVGNGPWRLTEWRPNEYIRVERNEFYWGRDQIRLDGIQFFAIDNQQTEERSFRAGELHMTESLPLHKIEVYRKENPDVLQMGNYLGTYFYRLNTTRPPFNDKRVRQAFAMAIDRDTLTATVCKAGERPAYAFTPPDTAGYTSSAQLSYNPERARELLAEAGYPNGAGLPPVEIHYNTSEQHQTIAEAVQSMLKRNLNADVHLLNQDWKVYLASQDSLDYSMSRAGWIADFIDPINFLECFLSTGGNNRTGYANPAYDALVQAAYGETSEARRREELQQAEAILLDDAPIIPVYYYSYKFLMGQEVKGYAPNSLDYRRWEDMWLEGRTASK